jgi:Major Facilitator Superfamily
MTVVALPWFILVQTGSALKASVAGFAIATSRLGFAVLGGPILDHLPLRISSAATDILSGLGIAAVPLLDATTGLALVPLLMAVAIGTVGELPGLSAKRAMLPDLAARAQLPVERTNGLFEGLDYLAIMVGGPLAGLLIGLANATIVLCLDAATFAISAALVTIAVSPAVAPTLRLARPSYLRELRQGLSLLWNERLLRALALSLSATNLAGAAAMAVVFPVYVRDEIGNATALGLFAAAFGLGALIGSLSYARWATRLRPRAVWLAAFLISPLEYWILLLHHPSTGVIMTGLLAVGILGGMINPLTVTVRQRRTDDETRGRIFTNFSVVVASTPPLGILGAGILISVVGLHTTILILAICSQAAGAALPVIPALRELDKI